ncbi:MAG: tripartite tricarboxylate transporter family receptor [Hyphomicrobiales bacterium]|nr:tripartite tricarboxylate transporter family receptor [Hyphomicrobiales bacterium]
MRPRRAPPPETAVRRVFARRLCLSALTLALSLSPAAAQDGGFFAGKTIRILVGYAPGSTADADPRAPGRPSGLIFSGPGNGFETYARVLARHLGRFIPGRPSVVVQNMPGLGGLRAAAYLADEAAPDGLTLGLLNPVNAVAPLLTPSLASFDARRFGWLGSLNRETGVCAFWSPRIETLDDLRHRRIVMGGTGPQAPATIETRVLDALLGLRTRMVLGYPSIADMQQPAERGEIDGFCGQHVSTMKASMREDVMEGRARLLVQTGLTPHPKLPPDIPHAFALAPNEEAREIMKIVFGPWSFGKPLAAPPGMPADRLEVLREALRATLADASFLGEAARGGMEIDPTPAAEIEKLLGEIYATPPDTIAQARRIVAAGQE